MVLTQEISRLSSENQSLRQQIKKLEGPVSKAKPKAGEAERVELLTEKLAKAKKENSELVHLLQTYEGENRSDLKVI